MSPEQSVTDEAQATLAALRAEIARLAARVTALEGALQATAASAAAAAGAPGVAATSSALDTPAARDETASAGAPGEAAAAELLPEETLAVIAAAIAAYLGKKPRIRQVTLVGSRAWAQQGRVGIQGSHSLPGRHG
jgi:methylmalonyl-CoA carboxyltransferase large subunit